MTLGSPAADGTTRDRFGATVEAADPQSVEAWNLAWKQAMHFVDDPFATLAAANEADEAFALGSIFCGTYRVLGGARPDDPALQQDLERAHRRASSAHARGHVEALRHLVEGNFTLAGRTWDRIAATQPDFAAVRFAHDVYLHVGDEARRLQSSQRAFDSWAPAEPGWGLIAGQLSFALEEVGLYDEAEVHGRAALADDPLDLWARHALAHLYETLDDSDKAFALLVDDQDIWSAQDGLAVHIWWHLALRLIAAGRHDEALAVHDAQQPAATTPFRLSDLASLLWRLELEGVDVGNRWDALADRFAGRPEWHTSGFLDLHGAFIYTRRPDHGAADRFFSGLAEDRSDGAAENDHIFTGTVEPLVAAIRVGSTEPARAIALLDELASRAHRIGGSIAQRDILDLTRTHYEQRIPDTDALEAT